MQVLKDEMRDRILEAAVKEFKDKGFKNASMRSMAKNAGMTVGNMYRYFENKEALFSTIVTPAFDMVVDLINEHNHPDFNEETDAFVEFMADSIVTIFVKHREALLILIDGSEGTSYEKVKCKIIRMIEKHNHESIGCIFPTDPEVLFRNNAERSFICYIMSNSFIEGLIRILKSSTEEKEIKSLVVILMKYCFSKLEERFS
ncbi:transcriptional regulator, TetR family [Natronincola peptidivorans]|uniref:Transcriptional regulator, TetR family n=1 Tax=Natronincola peptidivorans TaxID=426128 RepID=A0A1I0EBC1_9FIRM|nr:TetR/AcrR family transcriptional regulator [Natronincola peptidivorans]SET42544.1 transcriptional regulator, TetR family [Natronincola peptidivorans]